MKGNIQDLAAENLTGEGIKLHKNNILHQDRIRGKVWGIRKSEFW